MKRIFCTFATWTGAVVMVYYGGGKIGDPDWLGRLGILGGWPMIEAAVSAWLPWLEVGLGFLLLSDGEVGRGARKATALLLFGFLPFLVYFLISGMTDCGCGGAGGGVLAHPAFGIARNIALGVGLLLSQKNGTWPFSSFDRR